MNLSTSSRAVTLKVEKFHRVCRDCWGDH